MATFCPDYLNARVLELLRYYLKKIERRKEKSELQHNHIVRLSIFNGGFICAKGSSFIRHQEASEIKIKNLNRRKRITIWLLASFPYYIVEYVFFHYLLLTVFVLLVIQAFSRTSCRQDCIDSNLKKFPFFFCASSIVENPAKVEGVLFDCIGSILLSKTITLITKHI